MKLSQANLNLLSISIIAAVIFLFYLNSINNSFNYDDGYLIENNPKIERLDNYIFTNNWFRTFNNRSLTYLSFALNYSLGELNPEGYHLFNLAVQIISSLGIYFLVLILIGFVKWKKPLIQRERVLFPLAAALVFGLHPIQTDAVSYITQRMASMAGMFVILSTLSYVRFRIADKFFIKSIWLGLCIIAFAGGFLSKESGLYALLTIMLVEFFFLRKREGKETDYYLYGMIAAYVIVPSVYFLVNPFPYLTTDHGVVEYFFTQQKVILTYLGLLFYPLNLHVAHLVTPEKFFFSFAVIGPMLVHIGLTTAGIFLYRNHKWLSFSIFWFYAGLILESSLFPLPYFMNEYRVYISAAGFAFAVSYGFIYIRQLTTRSYPLVIFVVLLIFYGMLTRDRNEAWQDPVSLWTDNTEKSPENPEGFNALGYALYQSGRYMYALEALTKAIQLDPNYYKAVLNRGMVYSELDQDKLALEDFERVLKQDSTNYLALSNKGTILAKRGDLEAAKQHYLKSLKSNPIYFRVYYNLGQYYYEKSDYDSAYLCYTESIKNNPKFRNAFNNRGVVLMEQKKLEESLADFFQALRLSPDYVDPYINLGILFRNKENFDAALYHLNRALMLEPHSPEGLFQRSITYMKIARLDLAKNDAEALIRIRGNDPRAISLLEYLENNEKSAK